MERSEPALVPEWLRTTGSLSGGGSSNHHFLSAASHSDAASLGHQNRDRTSKSVVDFDTPRSPFLDRSSSSNSRRSSSSNGSTKHAYSSFSRSHRERDRDKEKERSNFGDHWDSSGPLGSMLARVENDKLRHSQSMVTRKQGELMLRKTPMDSRLGLCNNHHNSNGTHLGVSTAGSTHKAGFEKNFPSLANEERQGMVDTGRTSSHGLTTSVQSLPISSSALIAEGWKSALIEVPPSPVQQATAGTSVSGALNTGAGLNMAETLTQAVPSRSNTDPQLSVKTQRLEELAIKQSRQLIPVTPAMPKTSSVLNSDKSKPKLAARSGEMVSATKSGQQQQQSSSLHPAVQSQRVGNVKSDVSKTSHGKFLVLKPVWENGASPAPKDVSGSTNNASNRISNGQPPPTSPSVASGRLKSSSHPKLSTIDRKPLKTASSLEKRPSLAQAQSRKDFLNLMRKKSSTNTTAVLPSSNPEISSPIVEKSDEEIKELMCAPVSLDATENGSEITSNGSTCEESPGSSEHVDQILSPDIAVYPDEEEAAFLRSLGWEESAEEEEGLTEEEISAFCQEYMKLRPSLKLCGNVLPKLATPDESQAIDSVGAPAESDFKE